MGDYWPVVWLGSVAAGGLVGHFGKGRLGLGLAIGALLGPLGVLGLLVMNDARPLCPECRGVVTAGARRCRHCGSELPATEPATV